MAYYFAVETEKNSYIAKNIRSSKKFGSIYITTEKYECTLNEIDFFTTMFKNETELKETLLKEEIIKNEDIDKNLAIFLLNEKEQRLVSKEILYQDSQSMLYNPEKVVEYINKRAQMLDLEFFKQLEETQLENSKTKKLIKTISSIIEKTILSKNQELENEEIINAISKLLIYKIKRNKKGVEMCSDEVNYEKLHNIIIFINQYEMLINKNKTNNLKKIKEI